ncbi:MAG: hypothetical protein Q4A69_02200 [Moraxella sp.]|nr:hypothetical protein [Moraxella sp.]
MVVGWLDAKRCFSWGNHDECLPKQLISANHIGKFYCVQNGTDGVAVVSVGECYGMLNAKVNGCCLWNMSTSLATLNKD